MAFTPKYHAPDGAISVKVRGQWVALLTPDDLTQGYVLSIGNGSAEPFWMRIADMPIFVEGDSAAHTGVPTASAGTAAGNTPPAPVVAAGSRDYKGAVTFGTGGSPSGGVLVNVVFANSYDSAPQVVIVTPANAITGQLQFYVTNITAIGFSIGSNSAPAKNQINTTYAFDYIVQV